MWTATLRRGSVREMDILQDAVTCTQDGDIPHDDDSVFLNILASDGIHSSVTYPPFRTLLAFPTFLYVNVAPRNKTHIP